MLLMSQHVLIVGGQRCGSTALAKLLDSHPDVELMPIEATEPKTFRGNDGPFGHTLIPTTSSYRGESKARWFGEKSCCFMYNEKYPEAVRLFSNDPEFEGEIKIIAILRDPVQRALSHYEFSKRNGVETLDCLEAMCLEPYRRDRYDRSKFSMSPFAYIEYGNYAKYLRPWAERFDVLVVDYEAIMSGVGPPLRKAWGSIFSLLDIDPISPQRLDISGEQKPRRSRPFVNDYLREAFRLQQQSEAPIPGLSSRWLP